MTDVKVALHDRIRRLATKTKRVEVVWETSGSGLRMNITLKSKDGSVIDSWNDEMILGKPNGQSGSEIIFWIITSALASRISIISRGMQCVKFEAY